MQDSAAQSASRAPCFENEKQEKRGYDGMIDSHDLQIRLSVM
jgi:hypothetical protein